MRSVLCFRVLWYFGDGVLQDSGAPCYRPEWDFVDQQGKKVSGWTGPDTWGQTLARNPAHPQVCQWYRDYLAALLKAEGKKVDVYKARVLDPPFAGKQWDYGGAYSFANFDISGGVTLRITSPRSLRHTIVRPQSPAGRIKVADEHTLLLTLDGPRKLSIEPDGKKGPLLLFANPVEKDPPKAKDAGVIYFGPGIHKAELIKVRDNQTLYLAGGAVVHGAIAAQGAHIRICGRGILDGSDYEWRKGPHPYTIGIYGTDIELSGITVRGSPQCAFQEPPGRWQAGAVPSAVGGG